MANNNFIVRNGLQVGNIIIPTSSNTIQMGGGSIQVDNITGAIVFIPAPTVQNPNPVGIVISAAGTISTVNTTAGIATQAAIDASANSAASSGSSTVGGGGTALFEFDPYQTDGKNNLWPLYYNGTYMSVPSVENLEVTLDGVRQPPFLSNSEVTWLSNCLTSRPGYTLDTIQLSFNTTANGTISANTIVLNSMGNINSQNFVARGMLITGNGINANTIVLDSNLTSRTVTMSSTLSQTLINSNVNFAISSIKFSESPGAGSWINARTVSGTATIAEKKYPFKPLDVMLSG
jgi:hypothetical protein